MDRLAVGRRFGRRFGRSLAEKNDKWRVRKPCDVVEGSCRNNWEVNWEYREVAKLVDLHPVVAGLRW